MGKVSRTSGGVVNRRGFVGDPAQIPPIQNPQPTTPRGKRRSEQTQEYLDNQARRKQQSYPTR